VADAGRLSSEFLAAGGIAAESGAELEEALRARLDAGRVAWAQVDLATSAYVAHVAAHARKVAELPALKYAGDLFLACACAHGTPRAVEAFERSFAAVLQRAAARVDPTNADETVQIVRERLLVRTAARAPKIAEYGGRAKLSSWLAAVAAREAIGARRRMDDRSHDSLSGVAAAAPAAGPELEIIRARHAPDFREAIRVALSRLQPRQRALLRMNLSVGLSIDRIAEVYKISRATAARWLAAARQALQEGTRKELVARLRLSPSEIESLAAAMRSEMDLSVATLLGAEPRGGDP
jgi:RNA polymerase sigma-70 factor (ECF subfamily)